MALGNRNPAADQNAAEIEAIDAAISDEGYGDLGIEQISGGFAATAHKTVGATPYRAQALGRSRVDAARQLLATIKRP